MGYLCYKYLLNCTQLGKLLTESVQDNEDLGPTQ